MSSVRIQTGATERIEFLALDESLDPVTGKSDILLQIRRISDGQYLDFNDMTFKSSGWTTRQIAMTETDATRDAGVYHYDLNTGNITNATADDTYELRVLQSPGTDVKNVPAMGEIKVGQYVDDIDAAISSRATPADVTSAETNILAAITALNNLSQADVQAAMTAQGYTTVRAALLDNLDATISSVAAAITALNNLSITDVQTALTNQGYTSVRAALLDNLDATVSSRSSHSAADVDTQLSGTHGAGSWLTGAVTPAALWQHIVENGITAEEIMRAMLAVMAGISSGGGTSSNIFRDNADSKDRISATVDANGNRTAIVLDLT